MKISNVLKMGIFVTVALAIIVWGVNLWLVGAASSNNLQNTNTPTNANVQLQTGTCGIGSGGGCGRGCGCSTSPSNTAANTANIVSVKNTNPNNTVTAEIRGSNFVSQKTGKLGDAENAAYTFHVQKYGDSSVTVNAIDRGCHVEVNILKNGNVIRTLGYSNGQII